MLSEDLLYTRHYLSSDLSITMKEYHPLENMNLIFLVQLIVLGDMWNLDSFDSRCLYEIKIVHKKKLLCRWANTSGIVE